ncbi:hypothetical protein MSAN_00120000 [Mycena sanguinolenta]|uniref:Uncharacterized protein n=1 Tax=Mycena sanguinolenta TaxID=230812 RepID=A0A8H7DK02_9AGAR|nr:hypothetical protein MSAN_00120000 [Mycena sanguinolenta]
MDSDCNSAYTESEYLAHADSDLDVDAGPSHSQEDLHDSAGGSERTDISDCEGHDASESTSGAAQAHERSTLQKDIREPTLSWWSKCLMATQLALVLFLALSLASDHISISFSSVHSILRSLSGR